MSKPYKEPILTAVFRVNGWLSIIGGIILIGIGVIDNIWGNRIQIYSVEGIDSFERARVAGNRLLIAEGVGALLSGCLLLGVGQVIDFLGRTAHSTERTSTLLPNVLDYMKRLDERLNSNTPFHVRVEETKQDNARFYYAVDGAQQGSFTAGEMREMRDTGTITQTTPVFRKGDSQWRTFKDFPELRPV